MPVASAAEAYDAETEHLLALQILTVVCYQFKPKVSGI
jgi:hypothetical protein